MENYEIVYDSAFYWVLIYKNNICTYKSGGKYFDILIDNDEYISDVFFKINIFQENIFQKLHIVIYSL